VHQEWTDRLSDYLDGELSAEEQQAVEAHLRACAPCAAVLDDLKRVVARAATVAARPPDADVWAGIAARINAGSASAPGRVMPFAPREARRVTFTLPQLAAAAALLIAVSGGLAWNAAERIGAADSPVSVAQPLQTADANGASAATATGAAEFARVENVGLADAQYDAAVADLEKALQAGRGRLDASTIAIVEHNLQIIDQAIAQARDALAADPANAYLSGHLVEARRRKLDLLRRAAALSETD
jgi:anti-sigma factor RsiW